jgi:hypothetical protein
MKAAQILTLLMLIGTAKAATMVIPTDHPMTLTYDASQVTAMRADAYRCSGDSDVKGCFNLFFDPVLDIVGSGIYTFSFSISSDMPFHASLYAGLGAYVLPQPSDLQLRFSRPIQTWSYALTDLNTGALLIDHNAPVLPDESVRNVGITMTYTFAGGHYLTPSSDPTCAALSCMNMGVDRAQFASYGSIVGVSVVPESTQVILLTAGLAVISLMGRRRRIR